MVTVELAVGFCAITAVIAAVVGVISVVIAQLKCVDAAYASARVAARGESVAVAEAAGIRGAPDGAQVVISTEDHTVRSRVTVKTKPLGPLLPAINLQANAIADREPGSP